MGAPHLHEPLPLLAFAQSTPSTNSGPRRTPPETLTGELKIDRQISTLPIDPKTDLSKAPDEVDFFPDLKDPAFDPALKSPPTTPLKRATPSGPRQKGLPTATSDSAKPSLESPATPEPRKFDQLFPRDKNANAPPNDSMLPHRQEKGEPAGASQPEMKPESASPEVEQAANAPHEPLPATLQDATIEEESLSGRQEGRGEGRDWRHLTPEAVSVILKTGSPGLAQHLAERALAIGGAPLTAARWLQIQAEAHLQLGEFEAAQKIIAGLLDGEVSDPYPLILLLADARMGVGRYAQARSHYSEFLMGRPHHPHRFRAQRGVGLAALKLGRLREAELHLNLYAEEENRPSPDPLLILGQAELARAKGLPDEAQAYWEALLGLAEAPATGLGIPETTLAPLVEWLLAEKRWGRGVMLVERAIRQWGSSPQRLTRHADLHQPNRLVTAPAGGCETGTEAVWQRRQAIATLLDQWKEPLERDAQLEQLLHQELANPLGLLLEGGLLNPDILGLPEPLPPSVRLLYAKAWHQIGRLPQMREMLWGLSGAQAQGLRLILLGEGSGGPGESLEGVLGELSRWFPKEVDGAWQEELTEMAMTALMRFFDRRDEASVQTLRRFLTERDPPLAVLRAFAWLDASSLERKKNLHGALAGYLSLAYEPMPKEMTEMDRYLPMDPRLAAARVLVALGLVREAEILRLEVGGEPPL
ncbi:MAG: hypothetical protein HQL52_00705 [Magnetococcales bacterium]|nr:hypothetical protein [Magnetococcales bacterium]